ncbi:hypothetical protein TCAL_04341 [Tigriopus californicus]|uniref:DUF659 domain-containing protein n=1 Tax=Tigriopus californicus TaxID=6832 RepID=A0A553PST8_TIGCA|nr:hypothetical protein TCAL_04341 [Tigriopus californicus]|eukprot:TCALIF_04341-PA protein Name:"Protein of unknown function" AED:0.24 eAED:0.27 QI:0/0/0/0.66/1/1/3/0/328
MVGEDLCRGFLAADIPIKKLENPVLREVLESNLGIKLQREKVFRIKHIPKCYEDIMECIKEDLKEGPVWVSADCSRDALGREVANVIVGILDGKQYCRPHLIHVEFLEKADSAAMAPSFYSKHLSELEPVINSFDSEAARNISEVKALMAKDSLKADLAFIETHLSFLATSIAQLEEAGLTLHNSLSIVSMTQDKINSIPGSKGNIFKEKLLRVLAKNPGLKTLKEVDLVIQGQLQTLPAGIEPATVAALKFCPMVSVDVERSFSQFKHWQPSTKRAIKQMIFVIRIWFGMSVGLVDMNWLRLFMALGGHSSIRVTAHHWGHGSSILD